MTDERLEYFAKGYKKGLKEAWNEILKDASSGYGPAELKMMLKAKMGTVDRRVEAETNLLKNELGIHEEEAGSSGDADIMPGCSYIVKEARPDLSYKLFDYFLKEGHPGLCISRQNYEFIKKKHRISSAFTQIRLGKSDGGDSMLSSALGIGGSISASANLTKLFEKITAFMKESPGSVILLDNAVEYLMTQNEFQKVLAFIQRLNDRLESGKAYLLIGVSPNAFETQEMAKLEMETTDSIEGGR